MTPKPCRSTSRTSAAPTSTGRSARRRSRSPPERAACREAVLYDNGPIVTHPGGGFGGADASALQDVSLGMGTYGFGHQISANNRVADDFTVPAGSPWTIDTITFYAYQTGSTTTSTITDVRVQIWDGPPMVDGSNIVFGDLVTNRLASSTFSNVYRVLDSDAAGQPRARSWPTW